MYRFVVLGVMASKRGKKTTKKTQRYPVQRTARYSVGQGATVIVDVAKGLCAHNHRLYRQMRNYKVTLSVFGDANHMLKLETVPDTWAVKKACELARETLEHQYAMSERPRGRWDDFRIGWANNLMTAANPLKDDGSVLTIDEYLNSEIHDTEDNADFNLCWFGAARSAANNLYGVVEQYDLTGDVVQPTPSSGGTDPYHEAKADPDLIDAAGANKKNNGDVPPYDANSFDFTTDHIAARQLDLMANVSNGLGRMSVTFDAVGGLIKVTDLGNVSGGTDFLVTVHAGDYKGVKALEW